jgi:hypothetical protein
MLRPVGWRVALGASYVIDAELVVENDLGSTRAGCMIGLGF